MKGTDWKVGELKIITGSANRPLSEKICELLGLPLWPAKTGRFADGEIDFQIMDNVRGDDCYVIQPTCPPVNENVMELLIMLDALRRASAGRITAVMPYYGYGRADRKPAPRVAIGAKLVADLVTSAGADRVVAIDLHAAQIQGFFDVPMDHLYARPVVLDYIKGRDLGNLAVVSPDVGCVERARSFAKRLNAGLVIVDKRRPRPNQAQVYNIIGTVEGMTCFIFDDLVDTAGTLTEVARSLKERGAARVIAACTHGVLSGEALKRIDESPIEEMILTDTIPLNGPKSAKIKVVSVAALLAEVIKRNHMGQSISELFK